MEEKKTLKKLHIFIMIIGTIFIFLNAFHTNIWFDEAYSVGMANHTLIDIWNIGGHDVHPVLYYWMLRSINLLTNGSILAYRLFSVIPIALLGLLGFTHIKKDFGEKTGILFSFLCYFLPMITIYASQIRMYSWAIYIVTVLAIYSYRIYLGQNTIKNWIVFGVTSLASIFIHYYGLMAAGLINLLLLVYFIKNKKWQELKWQLFFGLIQILLYIPWLVYFISQIEHVSKGFWIGFDFYSLLEIIGCQMTGKPVKWNLWVGTIANLLLFIYLGTIIYKKRKHNPIDLKPVKYAIGLYLLVIIVAVIITQIMKTPIIYYRYLFVITGLYIFTVSYILSKENHTFLILLICICIIILGSMNNILQIKENYSEENGKQIEYLKDNIKEGDVLVYSNIGNGSVFAANFTQNKQYFYNGVNWGVEEAYKAWAPQMDTYITTDFLNELTGRIWIIDSQDNGFYKELFDNSDFRYISTAYFDTPYQNYIYNITLIERVNK